MSDQPGSTRMGPARMGPTRMGYVEVPGPDGQKRLELRPLPPPAAKKGRKARRVPDPLVANPDTASQQMKQFIDRKMHLQDQRQEINDDIRDVDAEAKAMGFDVKTLDAIITLIRMDPSIRAESEMLLETYRTALNL